MFHISVDWTMVRALARLYRVSYKLPILRYENPVNDRPRFDGTKIECTDTHRHGFASRLNPYGRRSTASSKMIARSRRFFGQSRIFTKLLCDVNRLSCRPPARAGSQPATLFSLAGIAGQLQPLVEQRIAASASGTTILNWSGVV